MVVPLRPWSRLRFLCLGLIFEIRFFSVTTSALDFGPQTGRSNLEPAMAKPAASAAALMAKANANGYRRGAHRERDRKRPPKTYVDKTKGYHDATLTRYVL
jgi:hypothetical protein